MALRAHNGRINNKRAATAVAHSLETVARRPVVAGALLTFALLALFAATAYPSGAATTSTAKNPTATMPAVSPVTVTVPAGSRPPAPVAPQTATTPAAPVSPPTSTAAPVSAPPAAAPPAGSSSTPTVSSAQSPSGSAAPAPAGASQAGSRVASTRSTRARGIGVVAQQQLRIIVVRLSQCLSTLSPDSQRMLLLRAGISAAQPPGSRAVARMLHISVAREARLEQDALLKLQSAARGHSCGSPPAWIHVPAGDRLVPVDAGLTDPSQPARATSTSGTAPSLRAQVTAIGNGKVGLWFTLSAATKALLSF